MLLMFIPRHKGFAISLFFPSTLMFFVPAIGRTQNEGNVKDQGMLKVADLRFDNYLGVVSSNLEVKSGDEAGMKFFVEGFSREERKDESGRPEYRIQLSYSIDITDPEGKSLQPTTSGK